MVALAAVARAVPGSIPADHPLVALLRVFIGKNFYTSVITLTRAQPGVRGGRGGSVPGSRVAGTRVMRAHNAREAVE